jgi:SAM-dependent methyltransferase
MAEDYEVLEPWYEHLYAVLHPLVLAELAPERGHPRLRALDAGCGTGFQTTLLERLGYETHGVDVAPRLLAAARERLPSSRFALASVEALPHRDATFNAAACCGSTLSFVDDPAAALGELARVLKPHGRLLLEVEHRWSLDLLWALGSALGSDFLGYGLSPREAWRSLALPRARGCRVTYPGYGPLHLFTRGELRTLLAGAGLRPVRWWGIHALTNLIPSPVLHRRRLGAVAGTLFRRLCPLDARLSHSWMSRLANSLVVLADKPPAD